MKKMDKLFNEISIVFGFLGGVLAYFLGGWDVLLKTIVCLAVLDYVTGVLKGIYLKQLSSETGFRGLLKKIVMFIVIAVAYLIQMLIGGTIPLRESGYYILHLQRSVESVGKCSGICSNPGTAKRCTFTVERFR